MTSPSRRGEKSLSSKISSNILGCTMAMTFFVNKTFILLEYSMSDLGAILLNTESSLADRVRALHDIRVCELSTASKVQILRDAVRTTSNVLLLHEIMYELGQIGTADEVDFLQNIMLDESHDIVTRHEAGEALGAIQSPSAIAILTDVSKSKVGASKAYPVELVETCDLAIDRIRARSVETEQSAYSSIDPALPHKSKSIAEMRGVLAQSHLDGRVSLYERYQALFRLREENDVEGLCEVMRSDATSALLRHEIAFVLGQMESERSVTDLCAVLATRDEHPMVRHEAAEALGAIATPVCLDAIKACLENPAEDTLVSDSCVIALDMYDYYKNWSNANR